MAEALALSIVGAVVGITGGLFGIGGSIVLIPVLTEYLGADQHRYQAAAMIVNFFVATPAVLQHRRARAIDARTVWQLAPIAAVGVAIGVGLSETRLFAGPGEPILRLLFGGFILVSAVVELCRMALRVRERIASEAQRREARKSWGNACAVAIPTGLVAGLLGVGGGIVAVPLQRRLLNLPLRQAIANSAALLATTSLIGALVKNAAYAAENNGSLNAVALAAIVAPTAVLGSLLGSYLTHRLPVRAMRILFIFLLLAAGVRFVAEAVGDLGIR